MKPPKWTLQQLTYENNETYKTNSITVLKEGCFSISVSREHLDIFSSSLGASFSEYMF